VSRTFLRGEGSISNVQKLAVCRKKLLITTNRSCWTRPGTYWAQPRRLEYRTTFLYPFNASPDGEESASNCRVCI
jgi:hypothetical protein